MADVEENIRWDLEFDKVRHKDDLGLILEDDWLLSDDILVSRVQELFDSRNSLTDELNELRGQVGFEEVNRDTDFPTPIPPLGGDLMEFSEDITLGEVKSLKRKFCDIDEKEEERGGDCLKRKRLCGDAGDQKKSDYAEKFEKSKRKLRDGYDSYSRNRKMLQVISLKEVDGSKRKLKTVVTTKTAMKGNGLNNKGLKEKQQCSNQNKVCKDGAKDVMAIDEKKKLNDVFKLSYAERMEMAKAKLQQCYDRCACERKKTCVISLKDIPKPSCAKRVGSFKRQHCLPMSNTIRGY